MKLKDMSQGRSDLLRFRYDQISPYPGLNVRDWSDPENVAAVAHMAEMIEQEGGIISPITICLHKAGDVESVYITDGETRWRAVGLLISTNRATAETYTFPAMPEPKGRNDASRDIDLVIRNSGRQFKPLEMASWCARMTTRGMSEVETAKAIGRTQSYVNNMLCLASADTVLHGMIREGKVAATTVVKAWREHGANATAMIVSAYENAAQERESEIEDAENIANDPNNPPPLVINRKGRKPLSTADKAARKVEKLSNTNVKVSASKLSLTAGQSTTDMLKTTLNAFLRFTQFVASESSDEEMRDEANRVLKANGYPAIEYQSIAA